MFRVAANAASLVDSLVQFRATPANQLRIVRLDSLAAIYQRASGQTHVVAEPVPELLEALSAQSHDVTSLTAYLGLEDNDDVRAVLAERLAELAASGLVVAE